jgi:hypothetical protein
MARNNNNNNIYFYLSVRVCFILVAEYDSIKHMFNSYEYMVNGDLCTINKCETDDELVESVKCMKEINQTVYVVTCLFCITYVNQTVSVVTCLFCIAYVNRKVYVVMRLASTFLRQIRRGTAKYGSWKTARDHKLRVAVGLF